MADLSALVAFVTRGENQDTVKDTVQKMNDIMPDMTLLDMEIPVMNGYQAVQIIKSAENSYSISIVAVTAPASKETEENIKAICDRFLSKPIGKKRLIRELTNIPPYG